MVIWLIGLSGAGKTTFAKEIFRKIKMNKNNVVLIDGDEIRRIFKHDRNEGAYSTKDRRINIERIVALCEWLDKQGINVICSTLCIFEDILSSNKNTFSNYYEIYMQASLDVVSKRDVKNLYKSALEGKSKNVVGIDIPFPEPKHPNKVVRNNFKVSLLEAITNEIVNEIISILFSMQ